VTDERTDPGRSGRASRRDEERVAGNEEGHEGSEGSGEPIGPFPTWRALYTTVLVWSAVTVGALYAITVLFDRSLP